MFVWPKRLAMPLSASLMLAACQTTTTPTGGTDTACLVFKPITYSRQDTPVTVRQIVGHNAAHAELCDEPDHQQSHK